MTSDLDRLLQRLEAFDDPPLASDVIGLNDDAREHLPEEADGVRMAELARGLARAAAASGAVTWDLTRRQQLERAISFWTRVTEQLSGEPSPVQPLALFDESYLPRLAQGDEEEALRTVADGRPLVGTRFEGCDFTSLEPPDGAPVRIFDCAFRECTFKGVRLAGSRILYSAFTACDLSGAVLEDVVATSSLFGAAKLDGVKAYNGTFSGSRFEETSMRAADLRACSFASAEFRAVQADNACFEDSLFDLATLADVSFVEASMARTIFTGANVRATFRGADLSLSIFSSADVHAGDFRGANVENATFATAVGRRYASSDGDLPDGPDAPPTRPASA